MSPKLGFKSNEEKEFPNIVNVCVFKGACPCECVHCPVGLTPERDRAKRFGFDSIGLKLFKRIVDEVSVYHHSTLRIHSVGEPLLWPRLKNALSYMSDKKVRGWIFTSLITTDNALIESMAYNCSIIEVSINSTTQKDYIKTKGVD